MKKKMLSSVLFGVLAVCVAAPAQAQTTLEWIVLSRNSSQPNTGAVSPATEPQCPVYLFDVNIGQGLFNYGACLLDAGTDDAVFDFDPQPAAAVAP